MGMGKRIKYFRMKANLTQEALADRLDVPDLDIADWETDKAEPSLLDLRRMAGIFGCSVGDLTDDPVEKKTNEVKEQTNAPVLAVCENCNKPIYDPNEIRRFDVYHGRTRGQCVYCANCFEERQSEIEQQKAAVYRKKRIHAFIWPSLIFAALLAVAILMFTSTDKSTGFFYLGTAFLAFFFSSCLILDNNFIGDLWSSIAGWGFIRLPGMIWELSLGGIIIGILIKIALWILGLMLGIVTTILATVIGMALSVFVYPFALAKNIKAEKAPLVAEE